MCGVTSDEVVRILTTSDLASETASKLITPITEIYVDYHRSKYGSLSSSTDLRVKHILPLQAYLRAACLKLLTANTPIPLGVALFLYKTILPSSDSQLLNAAVAEYATKPSDLVPFAVLLGKDVYDAVHKSSRAV